MKLPKFEELNRQLLSGETKVQLGISSEPFIQFTGQDWESRVFVSMDTLVSITDYAYFTTPEKFVNSYMKEHSLRNYLRPTEMHSEYTTEQRIAPLLSEMIKEYIKLKEE